MRRALLLLAPVLLSAQSTVTVQQVQTTAARAFAPAVVKSLPHQDTWDLEITNLREQMVRGFGGCFNELGWEALKTLDPEARNSVLKAFYSSEGCAFNLARMPVGANDYAVDWYSLNETKGDFAMAHFNLERDRQRLIPFIKAAQAVQPGLEVWASPWCPPSWMKNNDSYACQSGPVNDLKPEMQGTEMRTQFRMEAPYLNAYADYMVRFVKAYAQEGIAIRALHVQNEFNSCQVFPSCVWDPKDLGTFIGQHLGPAFKKAGLDTDIWLGTVERPFLARVQAVLENPEARSYVKGISFQWAGKDGIRTIHRVYPGMRLMQSESECGDGSNDWKAGEYTFGLMKHYFENGVDAYMYWNLVLNETGASRWGWVQNALVTVNQATHAVRYNPEFQVMKHFAHFVKPGAHKLATTGQDQEALAFENPDGTVILVLRNASDASRKLKVHALGQDLEVGLEARSFSTVRVKKN